MRYDDSDISSAARRLREGALVAFPTETVYGLGADATSPDAVARIFAVKGRPVFNPLIAHVATLDQALAEGVFGDGARRLAEAFWPGPLTLVVPRSDHGAVCDLACAGLSSIGIRIPNHPIALSLLRDVGAPVAAPSANRSGRLSPTRAQDVRDDLGDAVDLLLDGGDCPIGVESTIVACLEGRIAILRPGAISSEAIEACLGRVLDATSTAVVAPGMLASHYAPRASLRLDVTVLSQTDVGLDFGGRLGAGVLDLSPIGDLREAAANLYRHLRSLDAGGAATIAVAPIPMNGIGAAINDRLRRAAAPRPIRS